MHIEEDRLDMIKKDLDKGGFFSCHKTVYPDLFGHEDIGLRMCYGAYEYLKDTNNPNQVMQVAERMGIE